MTSSNVFHYFDLHALTNFAMALQFKEHLPKTDFEADQRLINKVRKVVIEEGLPISQANRMLFGYIRNKKDFESVTWPNFVSSLQQ